MTYKINSRDKMGAFTTNNPKYKEYLLQSNNQIDKGNFFLSNILLKFFLKPVIMNLYHIYSWMGMEQIIEAQSHRTRRRGMGRQQMQFQGTTRNIK